MDRIRVTRSGSLACARAAAPALQRAGLGLAFALPLWLGGCATSPDPHQGGFVSGVVGLAGGGYQRRIDEREATYRGELSAQERLAAQARELERERAQVRSDLGRANARLAALESRVKRERALLAAQGKGTAASRAQRERLDRAESQIVVAKGQLRSIRPNEQPVPDLKARARALDAELNEIDGMVGTVSGKGI
jgi:hypothetical protein